MRYIYLTTNTINGKKYLGQRKVPKNKTPESDNYLGSGTLLLKAIKKYGKEQFTKEILHKCYTQADADILEIQEIEQRQVLENRDIWYNRDAGGQYGRSEKHSQIASEYMKEYYLTEIAKDRVIKGKNDALIKAGKRPLPYSNYQEYIKYHNEIKPRLKQLKLFNKRFKRKTKEIYRSYTTKKQLKTKQDRSEVNKRNAKDAWKDKDKMKQALQKAMDRRLEAHKQGAEFFSNDARVEFALGKYRQHNNTLGEYLLTNDRSIDLKPIEHNIKRVISSVYKSDINYTNQLNMILQYITDNSTVLNVDINTLHNLCCDARNKRNVLTNRMLS